MRSRIDPKVDYAFKKLFGSIENKRLLIAFLRAVLQEAILEVELLNPFNEKEYIDDKQSILDIKARLQDGRLINIEMQVIVPAIYPNRALYYWARTYHQQLHEGDEYAELRTTISIHILNEVLFDSITKYHTEYRLREIDQPEVEFSNHLQIHAIELPKFNLAAEHITSPLEQWCYFLKHGKELDRADLPTTMQGPEIDRAMEVLEIMTQNDRERFLAEAQERAWRDAATNKRVFFQEGKEAGLQEGKELGVREGTEIGIQKGKHQERIDALEMMLEIKFGSEGVALMEEVRAIDDLTRLRELQESLRKGVTLEEFRTRLV